MSPYLKSKKIFRTSSIKKNRGSRIVLVSIYLKSRMNRKKKMHIFRILTLQSVNVKYTYIPPVRDGDNAGTILSDLEENWHG